MKRRSYNKHYRLKEILKYLLMKYNEKCYFCHQEFENLDRITIHHVDHNRNNNSIENLVLSHRNCHKAYHLKINCHGGGANEI